MYAGTWGTDLGARETGKSANLLWYTPIGSYGVLQNEHVGDASIQAKLKKVLSEAHEPAAAQPHAK